MAELEKRGRKSGASLEIASFAQVIDRVERPKAPHHLSDEETEVWAAVVDSMPADWFSPASYSLLTQFCRHAIHARRIAERLERRICEKDFDVQEYDKLLQMQARETMVLNAVGTKLRITPHSITNHRGNQKTSFSRKLWEG